MSNAFSFTDKLAEICATKRAEVDARKAAIPRSELQARADEQDAPRGFQAALDRAASSGFGLIAEIKKASPSKGLIRRDFDPADHARAYQAGGAACLSVLTDAPYFQGHEDYLVAARNACDLPILRKDFMIDPWQVAESRSIGADAILIIVTALEDTQMAEIEAAAIELGMDALIETHNEAEMERAYALKSRLIGVNNRNLNTFEVDFENSYRLVDKAPENCSFVAESGLGSHDDLSAMAAHGIRRFLVGESLMRKPDVEAATRALLGN